MIRALLLCLILFALALVGVWFADRPGSLRLDWMGLRIDTTAAFGFSVVMALAVGFLLVLWSLGRVLGGARQVAVHVAGRHGRRAQRAVREGVVALLSGDLSGARRAARTLASAQGRSWTGRSSREDPLVLLLRAETAAPSERSAVFQSLLEDPATQLKGHLGLSDLAREEGRGQEALDHARQAVRRAPGHAGAFEALFALLVERRAWSEARSTVEAALRHGALTDKDARPRLALILAANGHELFVEGRPQAALAEAQRALGLDPACLPAGLLTAAALSLAGRRGRAATVIEAVWAGAPHPRLADLYLGLWPRESAAEALGRAETLRKTNPDHVESRLLMARAALASGDTERARDALQPLAGAFDGTGASMRVCLLMADLMHAEGSEKEAVDRWTVRALDAPRDTVWTCKACGARHLSWMPVCPSCDAFGTLVWGGMLEDGARDGVSDAPAVRLPEPVMTALTAGPADPGPTPSPKAASKPDTDGAAEPDHPPKPKTLAADTAPAAGSARPSVTSPPKPPATRAREVPAVPAAPDVLPGPPDDPGPVRGDEDAQSAGADDIWGR